MSRMNASLPTRGLTVLALASDGDAASVAILRDGSCIVDLQAEVADAAKRRAPRPSHHLPALVSEALGRVGLCAADMDRFAVANGPAAFTSLRVSMALCQGLAWAAGRPVVSVGHLQVLAFAAAAASAGDGTEVDGGAGPERHRNDQQSVPLGFGRIGVVCDARMDECWVSVLEVEPQRWPRTVLEPVRISTGALLELIASDAQVDTRWIRGPGVADAAAVLVPGPPRWVMARDIARLAALADAAYEISADQLRPLYLRDKIALDIDEQRAMRLARSGA